LKAVILAAGIGSRLGKKLPKSLIVLPNGKTILENQLNALKDAGIKEIMIVIGFKKELIMEYYPNAMYIYNPMFHMTNTAKSLQLALELIEPDDVIWVNGDVFLEEKVIEKLIERDGNCVAVNKLQCGEEEVKYKTNINGEITEISKEIVEAEGEAVGVNKICKKKDFQLFLKCLRKCKDTDYFEKAIEMSIHEGVIFQAVDISGYKCIEVDFPEDLDIIRRMF